MGHDNTYESIEYFQKDTYEGKNQNIHFHLQ